jgi:hypothetical protein
MFILCTYLPPMFVTNKILQPQNKLNHMVVRFNIRQLTLLPAVGSLGKGSKPQTLAKCSTYPCISL